LPTVPAAIKDLTPSQAGDGVQLSFTLPTHSISREKLPSPPAVEILRGAVRSDGSADAKSFRNVYTIPGALVEGYRADGHVRFTDPIAPEETKSHPGGMVAYVVRTRASKKRASADSNVRHAAGVSRSGSDHFRRGSRDRVRGRIDLAGAGRYCRRGACTNHQRLSNLPLGNSPFRSLFVSAGSSAGQAESHAALLASSETNSYRDTSAVFDHTYAYMVRSVMQVEGVELESSDSQPVTVAPHDTFPPAAPQSLVAALLPGSAPGTVLVDLSWSINLETDLAGYRVYRSEQEGTRGQLLTPELLPTPADRDTSVQPGHRYWYTVTAVDRAGNESAPGAAVVVDVTQPSP